MKLEFFYRILSLCIIVVPIHATVCSTECLHACRLTKNPTYFLSGSFNRCNEKCGCVGAESTCIQRCVQTCAGPVERCIESCNCPCELSCKQICLRNRLGDDCLFMCGCVDSVSPQYLSTLWAIYAYIGLISQLHKNVHNDNTRKLTPPTNYPDMPTQLTRKTPVIDNKGSNSTTIAILFLLALAILGTYALSRLRKATKLSKKKKWELEEQYDEQGIDLLSKNDTYY